MSKQGGGAKEEGEGEKNSGRFCAEHRVPQRDQSQDPEIRPNLKSRVRALTKCTI